MLKKTVLLFLLIIPIYFITKDERKSESVKRIRIGVLPAEIALPFHVGLLEGTFKEHGWHVEVIPFQSAVELNQSFQTQEIDMILNDLVTTILLKDAGLKVSSIGLARGSVPGEGRIAIVSSPNSGIRTLKDLEGQSAALSVNTHVEFVFDTLLRESGVSLEKINKVKVPKIPMRLNLLLSDKVQSAVLPEPMATLAINEGAFLLRDDSDENYSQIVLTAHDAFIEREKENLHEFLTAYDQSVQQINTEPDKYRALYLKTCSIPEQLANSYPLRKFSFIQPVPKEIFTQILHWAEEKHMMNQSISFEDVYESQFQRSSPS